MLRGWFFVSGFIFFAVRTQGIPMGARYAPAPPGMRPSCATKRATFCEEVEKYPTKLIQKLLQSEPLNIASFFTDESDGLDQPVDYILHQDGLMDMEPKKASDKREKRSTGINNCPTSPQIVFPKAATNQHGQWKFIAQAEELNIGQRTTVHLCSNSSQCSQCTQMYNLVPMVSLHGEEEVAKELFWMPSSCYCTEELSES